MNEAERYLSRLENEKFTVEQLETMVEFLDDISAWYMEKRDKYDFSQNIPEKDLAIEIYKLVNSSKLISIIFGIRNRFNLSMDSVASAIFVRKMFKLMKFVRDASFKTVGIDLGFIQKVCHLMRDCERAQFATIKYLSEMNRKQALFFALFMNVPQENWTLKLKRAVGDEAIKEQMKEVEYV